MEENKIDMAIQIIRLKIAKEIKENKEHSYNVLKNRIQKLREEEKEIYNQNEEVINKVLTEYAEDVKQSKLNGAIKGEKNGKYK